MSEAFKDILKESQTHYFIIQNGSSNEIYYIDANNGHAVRFVNHEPKSATVFSTGYLQMAKNRAQFHKDGFDYTLIDDKWYELFTDLFDLLTEAKNNEQR